jgi:alkanesulfonate monooxygenase SsuD/methylene tetrahydromethanopterin reductase-like flavin-dependent oxidoreductase (luciferase family)
VKVGIGLPNTIRGTRGEVLIAWARRAEACGFSTLGTLGRIAYPSYSELIAIAAAAGATERIGLMSDILLGPIYSPVLLAKDLASLDQISGGRFVFGAAVGGRADDFEITGQEMSTRGRRWDEALELMHKIWRGEPPPGTDQPVAPTPTNGVRVPFMAGGTSDASVRRVVKWGIGWTAGGAPPEAVAAFAERVRTAWGDGGREGQPKIVSLRYFALGPKAKAGAQESLGDYYAWLGPYAERAVTGTAKTIDAVQEEVNAFENLGIDELIYFPAIPDVEQVDLLAEAVEPSGR